eukprot:Clim_evm238s157 gene=Clim_evmTU238s157
MAVPGNNGEGPKDFEIRVLKHLLDSYEQRALTYAVLDNAFKEYNESEAEESFVAYRQIMKTVTDKFKDISTSILDDKSQLEEKSGAYQAWVSLIEKWQGLEKSKLEKTVELHLSLYDLKGIDDQESKIFSHTEAIVKDLRKTLGAINEDIAECVEEIRIEYYDRMED